MDVQQNSAVLITGGRGFIGRATVKLLQRSGYRVLSLDAAPSTSFSVDREEPSHEEPSRGEPARGGPVRELRCDITTVDQLQRIFERERIGGIIHLAAKLPTDAQREPAQATRVNVEGSLNLLEMARRFDVRRFVFGSSLSVYGTCPADEAVSEAKRAAPEELYGAAKLYAEQLGAAHRHSYGLEFVSLRIGRVVGRGAQSTSSAWRSQIVELLSARHAAETTLPYVGPERVLLVHVEEVAKMLVLLLQAACPAHPVYNAVCESVVVADLKSKVESVNSNVNVKLGEARALGNPRLLDSSRFQQEFSFQTLPIFEQLRGAAKE
jgi:nucleoside-diphosphate-sugar epimerase